jgi:hypothetical protein
MVRYRGLAKNTARLFTAFALANLAVSVLIATKSMNSREKRSNSCNFCAFLMTNIFFSPAFPTRVLTCAEFP